MFVSEKIVFTELHKTGGTHICKLLSDVIGGKQIGKHNPIPKHLWGRFVLGSVRNPWDWYVSLWAYGCGGEGSVFQRTTRRIDLQYLNRQLHGEMGLRRLYPKMWIRQFWQDLHKPVKAWEACYKDYRDQIAFKKWLKLMMDPARRFDMGEGYGFSPVSDRFGLMTYRYLKLFTRLQATLFNNTSLARPQEVHKTLESNRLVNFVIRNEFLEVDLLKALESAGYKLGFKEKEAILAAKHNRTNPSQRFPVSHYYDQESIDLVAVREQIIIEIHGYEPPALIEHADVNK